MHPRLPVPTLSRPQTIMHVAGVVRSVARYIRRGEMLR